MHYLIVYSVLSAASLIGMLWGWGLTPTNWGWVAFSYAVLFASSFLSRK